MAKAVDIAGQVFGRLTVVSREGITADKKARWRCVCSCGGVRVVIGKLLRSGMTKSCGCLSVETSRRLNTKHGMRSTAEYAVWKTMRARCSNTKNLSYRDYGARGIRVCPRWESFERFMSDMGPRPSAVHTMERIDNNGDYEPGNCRWATRTEQANNKRSNRILNARGLSLPTSEWARRTGLNARTIRARLDKGWSHEAAIGPLYD